MARATRKRSELQAPPPPGTVSSVVLAVLQDGVPLGLLAFVLSFTNRGLTLLDDESSALSLAIQPLRATLSLFRSGMGQHGYSALNGLILFAWLRLTGGAFAWLRAPSIVFFLLGLFLLSRAVHRLETKTGGDVGATVLLWMGALWPYGYHFGRLAVWYPLAFLLVSA